jgi:hypothetical protein
MLCISCYIENWTKLQNGATPNDLEEPREAMFVVSGETSCEQHLIIQQGPQLPGRTQSGLLIAGN